jgi:D-alanyl-lipoteichoic acid acyltransferase DltB (MBOAT superfamily)
LVAALVFVWVYDRVYGSFGGGWKGGATYGLFAGILVNFPTWLFMNLVLEGFPYGLAWIWTIVGVVYGVILGAVAGALYKKEAAPAIA